MRYFIAVVLLLLMLASGLLSLFINMPGQSFTGPLEELPPDTQLIRAQLESDIRYLAEAIGERHYGKEGSLEKTARYIQERLARIGYLTRTHGYGSAQPHPFKNLEVEVPGTTRADEIVLIGAHYDTVRGSPGADDNASGVAALLDLARLLYGHKLSRTLRFVAFVNEEKPFGETEEMGSMVYARLARERNENIVAMISLESIGYYSDEPGSQRYPWPFSWFYPDTGSFLAFIGNFASREFVYRAIRSFRQYAHFPSEGLAVPEALVHHISRSDHASFWRHGYPALMITDTVPFRNPNYHSKDDTPDTLDFDRLTRVVLGLSKVLEDLANK